MFERLEGIKWDSVQGCYGPASDVPRCLQEATSDDDYVCRHAIFDLWNIIWHQGTIYEATPLVVPFLIELARISHW